MATIEDCECVRENGRIRSYSIEQAVGLLRIRRLTCEERNTVYAAGMGLTRVI